MGRARYLVEAVVVEGRSITELVRSWMLTAPAIAETGTVSTLQTVVAHYEILMRRL
jgi:hypothetical protein